MDKETERYAKLENKYNNLERRFFEQFEKAEREIRYNDCLFYELNMLQRENMELKSELNKCIKSNTNEVVEHDG